MRKENGPSRGSALVGGNDPAGVGEDADREGLAADGGLTPFERCRAADDPLRAQPDGRARPLIHDVRGGRVVGHPLDGESDRVTGGELGWRRWRWVGGRRRWRRRWLALAGSRRRWLRGPSHLFDVLLRAVFQEPFALGGAPICGTAYLVAVLSKGWRRGRPSLRRRRRPAEDEEGGRRGLGFSRRGGARGPCHQGRRLVATASGQGCDGDRRHDEHDEKTAGDDGLLDEGERAKASPEVDDAITDTAPAVLATLSGGLQDSSGELLPKGLRSVHS